MKRAHGFTLVITLGLLMPLLAVLTGELGQPVRARTTPAIAQGPPLGPFIDIWVDGVDNHDPAVAYNSLHDEYLVVWWNDKGATRDIYARRVHGDGALEPEFVVMSQPNQWNWLPDVAYSPTQDEYLIAYTRKLSSTDYDIWARRVRWDGTPAGIDIAVRQESGRQWYPAVAYNSLHDEYLVAYENYWSDPMRDIAAQRVRASDGLLLSWRNIASAPGTVRRLPDVAYKEADNEYLIAYTYQASPTNGDIFGKVASFNMADLSSEIPIVNNAVDQDGVALAASAEDFLAIWTDGPGPEIYGRRVMGVDLSPFIPIATGPGQSCVEAAVAYGPVCGYLVTWRHILTTSDWNVHARYVKPGHDAAWGGEFPIDAGSCLQKSPAVACGLHGDCLVGEEDNWPWSGDYEIRGRFVLAHHIYVPLAMRNF